MAVRITRKDKSAGELRQPRCRDGKAARRMLAIALVLDGVDRKTAAGKLRHGSADAAGLGPPLQCGGPGRSTVARRIHPVC